jgi:flavin-binding protein dodecin
VAKQVGVGNTVYKVVEVVGTSAQSWEDAAKNAVETAGRRLRDLRVAEVVKTDMTVKDGKVQSYRARVMLSFKYES